jgi:hypothetical protein
MNEPAISGGDDARELRELMSQYDAPAYVRRARAVEAAYEQIVGQCRRQRAEMLTMVRTRLGQLVALAGNRDSIRPVLADDDQMALLQKLYEELQPSPRVAIVPTTSLRTLRRALKALRDSIARFNSHWQGFLASVDLDSVNALREGYNRHYLLEKECALRSPRLARIGFRQLEPLKIDELAALFPLLPVPRLAAGEVDDDLTSE